MASKTARTNELLRIPKFYGAVIVVLIIMLFSWLYLEFLTPLQIIETPKPPSRCVFSSGIPCLGQQVSENDRLGHGVLRFVTQNELGKRANFYFNATYLRDDITTGCIVTPSNGMYIRPGTMMEVVCYFDKPFLTESKMAEFEISGSSNYSVRPFEGNIYGVIIK